MVVVVVVFSHTLLLSCVCDTLKDGPCEIGNEEACSDIYGNPLFASTQAELKQFLAEEV